ncbi:MAG: alpha/beta hydrolase [Bacillota bacterium]
MEHIFKNKDAETTLVLFHGTGGDEHDMIPLGEMIDTDANLLSLRGTVNENGLLRFFKRIKPGIFDENDLKNRTNDLNDTLKRLCERYGVSMNTLVLMGYSNGANIISSFLSLYGKKVKGAIILHPMTPYKATSFPDLSDFPVFIAAGKNDPIVAQDDTLNLQALFEKSGVKLEIFWHNSGHQLTNTAIETAQEFYTTYIK